MLLCDLEIQVGCDQFILHVFDVPLRHLELAQQFALHPLPLRLGAALGRQPLRLGVKLVLRGVELLPQLLDGPLLAHLALHRLDCLLQPLQLLIQPADGHLHGLELPLQRLQVSEPPQQVAEGDGRLELLHAAEVLPQRLKGQQPLLVVLQVVEDHLVKLFHGPQGVGLNLLQAADVLRHLLHGPVQHLLLDHDVVKVGPELLDRRRVVAL
mmetsp:Transcript_10802/g.28715  ORF Transcript_10802/g.28715 Transcript_10802/m.28715 type:complete len:211 (-) Transcript_10802:399-1031(-)